MKERFMWNNVGSYCQKNKFRRTYKTASRPTGWDGSVGHLDGYDASQWLRDGNTVKLIGSGKIKQMKEKLIWKYVESY